MGGERVARPVYPSPGPRELSSRPEAAFYPQGPLAGAAEERSALRNLLPRLYEPRKLTMHSLRFPSLAPRTAQQWNAKARNTTLCTCKSPGVQ